jgi:hypothetical protein
MARSLFIIEAIPQLKDVFQTLRPLFHHQPLKPPGYRAHAEGQKEVCQTLRNGSRIEPDCYGRRRPVWGLNCPAICRE